MQYAEIFSAEKKNENLIGKNFDIFNIVSQNIDCGYPRVPTIYVLDQK